jgi:hypothetical protein
MQKRELEFPFQLKADEANDILCATETDEPLSWEKPPENIGDTEYSTLFGEIENRDVLNQSVFKNKCFKREPQLSLPKVSNKLVYFSSRIEGDP